VFQGRFYDVWQQGATPEVIAHMPLGKGLQPAAVAFCDDVRQLARRAERENGRLAYVERGQRIVLSPTKTKRRPRAWTEDVSDSNAVHAQGQGAIRYRTRVDRRETSEVWLQGSFGRPTSVTVDGKTIGSVSYELNGPRQFAFIGRVELTPGRHDVEVFRAGGSPRPGNGGDRLLGPVVLSPEPADRAEVEFTSARDWRALCGHRLDWIEVVRGEREAGRSVG
jgi:hypothetical protein